MQGTPPTGPACLPPVGQVYSLSTLYWTLPAGSGASVLQSEVLLGDSPSQNVSHVSL